MYHYLYTHLWLLTHHRVPRLTLLIYLYRSYIASSILLNPDYEV